MENVTPIKILVATGIYPPDIGGPATYSRMLEEKLHAHGVAVEVIPFGKVRHLPKVIRHLAFAWLLFTRARQNHIVYALDSVSVGLPAWFVSLIMRKPFMIRLGGDYAWEQGQQRFGLRKNLDEYTKERHRATFPVRALAWIQSFVVMKATIVIAPSEYLKSIIATWGVDPSRIHVIYSALFPLEAVESRAAIREQLSYEGTVITTVGRLVPWKGIAALIEVVAQLITEIPDLTLVIIGDGPEQKNLEQKIEELGIQSHVRLVGRLGKDALGAAIKGSDLFVLNTSYEGLSHQLLEVMDLGVPIVTTNVGGNPELIVDGVSGFMVPPKDKEALKASISRILQNEPLRVRMIQNAKVRTKDFSQDMVVARLAKVVQNI